METLTLKEAASFLKMHPQTLRTRAITGLLPGAKIGKSWVFIKEDLAHVIRSRYISSGRAPSSKGDNLCFTDDPIVNNGGADSPHQTEKRYEELLKPATKKKH